MADRGFVIERAQILSVGTELLIGQTLDTNAHFLARQLTELGIASYRHSLVGDNEGRLEEELKRALDDNDLVITTGGLGPTADDVTSSVAAKIFDVKLAPTSDNLSYPLVPEGAFIFPNDNGSAPGSLLIRPLAGQKKAILLLPGPPDEMEPMFLNYVKASLDEYTAHSFIHRYVRLFGIGESKAEAMARHLLDAQGEVTIAPYASPREVVFRVSQRRSKEADGTLQVVDALTSLFGDYVFEVGERPLEQVVLDLLIEKKKTVAFAESLTAGMAASTMASLPGASGALAGGVVTYNDRMKERLLGVPHALLAEHGAVSEQVARRMAEGCLVSCQSDFAISLTGIAGPAGGSERAPVGTVWIALAEQGTETTSFLYHMRGLRERVRLRAVYHALDVLRKRLITR